MKLIVGLGNPDKKYKHNRHNVGHMFVDFVRENFQFSISNFQILRTDTFMNESGNYVAQEIKNLKVEIKNLVVVHDDLDLKLGSFKIQLGTGPKIHYGLNSIEKELGTSDFWRVRIGVDNRDPNSRALGEEYVLEDFTKEELKTLDNLFPIIVEDLSNKSVIQ